MESTEEKLKLIKTTLQEIENSNNTAIIQEELLLKQMKEAFEIDTLEEGYELYDQLIEERNAKQKKVANQTESLYSSLVAEGLIDAI